MKVEREMKSFNDIHEGDNLRWVASGKLESQLQTASGEVLATLEWNNRCSSLVTGESADGKWTPKRAGFLPRVTIRRAGMDATVAEIQVNWNGGGDVRVAPGSEFQFRRLGFWNPGLGVFNVAGQEILSTKPNLSGQMASVKIKPSAENSPTKSLLAILSWYVIILSAEYDSDSGYMTAIVAIM